jgi:HlyD family secretion protein
VVDPKAGRFEPDRRTTPELAGKVTRISADVSKDAETGLIYYVVRVAFLEDQLQKLGELRLQAGMQAEVFLQTSDRTPFQYFLKPLTDQIARTFRER